MEDDGYSRDYYSYYVPDTVKTDLRSKGGLLTECNKYLNSKVNFTDCKCHRPHKDKPCYHLIDNWICSFMEGRD